MMLENRVEGGGDCIFPSLSSERQVFGICPLETPYYHTCIFKNSDFKKINALFFHIMNLYLKGKLTRSYRNYSDFFGCLFIITQKKLLLQKLVSGLGQNPFCRGHKTSQTCALEGLLYLYGIPLFLRDSMSSFFSTLAHTPEGGGQLSLVTSNLGAHSLETPSRSLKCFPSDVPLEHHQPKQHSPNCGERNV